LKNDPKLLTRVEEIVTPVLEKLGLELVDVEYIQDGAYWFLRVYIERLNGEISLDDCAKVSHEIEEIVDSIIKDKFFLEVSSPGLERPLKKERDFERFSGKKIKVILKQKINDSRNWTGLLEKFENKTIYLNVGSETFEIPYSEIKKANLVFEFEDF